jgi:hypothetical protein
VPKQLAFGFVGSTGTKEDLHEVSDVEVQTFTPVPQLAITNTSYSIAAPGPGQPVNYLLTPSVRPGATETSPISVVETLPSGVLPVGAYGTGWACGSRWGRPSPARRPDPPSPAGRLCP